MALILCAMLCLFAVFASAEVYSGTCGAEGDGSNLKWQMDTNTGVLTVTGTGAMKEYPWSAPWSSYDYCMYTVVIGDGVTSISANVFDEYIRLKSVTIGKDVETIGNGAFRDCRQLASITLPDSVKTVGDYAFSGCHALTGADLGDGVVSVGNNAFYNCKDLKSLKLGSGVVSIGSSAFSGCTSLEQVRIPDHVQTIGGSAFYNCTALKDLTIGSGVTTVEGSAFGYCSSLEQVYIPAGVESLVCSAFLECAALTAVEVAADNAAYSSADGIVYSKDGGTLLLCPAGKTTVVIPDEVHTIGEGAFYSCKALTELTVGTGVREIGNNAFYGCNGLKIVHIKDLDAWFKVEIQDTYADPVYWAKGFYMDGAPVTELTVPDGVTAIRDNAFSYSKTLEKVTIPSSVTSIGRNAFYQCNKLKQATVGAQTIGETAFAYCSALETLELSAGVQTIGAGAFSDCGQLKEVHIPDGVTSIGSSAFYRCSAMETLTIGTGLTTIGSFAFQSCTKLKEVHIPDGVTTISSSAFDYCTALKTLRLPASLRTVGDRAFNSCTALDTVTYAGTYSQWQQIQIGTDNDYLILAYDKDITGTCGASLTWKLSMDGILQISGTGEMTDYTKGSAPWAAYADRIVSVAADEGVTSFGNYAFYNCKKLAALEAPASLRRVGEGCFYGCEVLPEAVIPAGATEIAAYTFYGCKAIATLDLEATKLETVGEKAFYGCAGLKTVYLPLSIQQIGDGAFYVYDEYGWEGGTDDVYYPGTKAQWDAVSVGSENGAIYPTCLVKQALGGGVYWELNDYTGEMIVSGQGAIPDCDPDWVMDWYNWIHKIRNITILDGVTHIGAYSFRWLPYVTQISLPNSVQTIGDGAFMECPKLETVDLGNNVQTIGKSAFESCSALREIDMGSKLKTVKERAFYGCTSLVSATYAGTSAQNISVASGNEGLKLLLSGSVSGTFAGVSGTMTWTLDFNGGVLTISGTGAMEDLYSNYAPWEEYYRYIRAAVVEKGITYLGGGTFMGCNDLRQVQLPEGLQKIGGYAFVGTALEEISIPASVTECTNFTGCRELRAIWVHKDNPRYMDDDGVLMSKDGKRLIRCPEKWQSSDYRVADSVQQLDGCFEGSESLTQVRVAGSAAQQTAMTFAAARSGVSTVQLHDGITTIGGSTFEGCTNLQVVELPGRVDQIGARAFYGCEALEDVYYIGSRSQWEQVQVGTENDALDAAQLHFASKTWTSNGDGTHMAQTLCADCDEQLVETELCADRDGDTCCDACGAVLKTITKVTVAGSNMTLGNELEVNFMVTKKDLPEGDYTAYITQYKADGTTVVTELPMAKWTSLGNVYHVMSAHITAKEMSDQLAIEVRDAEGNVYNEPYSTSVRDYAGRALAASSTTAKVKIMMVDMVNYGASAQKQFGYATGDLANSALTAAQAALASAKVSCTNDQVKGKNCYGANLSLDDRIEMNVFFSGLKNKTVSKMYAMVTFKDYKGKAHEVRVEGSEFIKMTTDLYGVVVDDIVLADAKQMVTVTVYNADGTQYGSAADSVSSYVARAEANNADGSGLYSNILKFATSAYNYLTA